MATGTFNPIRTAFDNLNSLMLDQRQWDERLARQEMDDEWRHTKLRSDLAQQQFNNEMTERSQVLAERGFADRHVAHLQALKQANLDYDATKAQLDFDHKRRPLMLKEQTAKIEGQQTQNKLLSEQLKQELWETEETPLDVSYLDPADYNEQTLSIINQTLGERGMQLTPDGKILGADGSETKMPRFMQNDVHKVIVNSALLNDQTKSKVMAKVQGIKDQLADIKKQHDSISDMADGGLGKVQKASMARQYKELVAQAKKEAEFFKPENQIEHLTQQATMMERAATEMSTGNANRAFVEALFESAARKRKEAQDIADAELAKQKIAATGQKDELQGALSEKQMLDKTREGYLKQNPMGAFISDPKMEPKMRTMENAVTALDAASGKDPKARLGHVAFVREKTEEMEDLYFTNIQEQAKMSTTQLTQEWQMAVEDGLIKKNIKTPPNMATMKKDLKEAEFLLFVQGMREMSGNPSLYVYKPKKATRMMNPGGTQGE